MGIYKLEIRHYTRHGGQLRHVDAKNAKGEVEHWQAEATSPNHLIRNGWK
jgi:hypothetical protein